MVVAIAFLTTALMMPLSDSIEPTLRQVPTSVLSEQAILGGLMTQPDAFESIEGIVKAEDFHDPNHRLIFQTLLDMKAAHEVVDIFSLLAKLTEKQIAQQVGGYAYLSELLERTPNVPNMKRYGEIVRDLAIRRELMALGETMVEHAYVPQGRSTDTLVKEAEQMVLGINEKHATSQKGFVHLQKLLVQVHERLITLTQSNTNRTITGVETGFKNLDRVTAGLQPGDLIIVAGRPSMGKTSFALNIAEFVGVQKELPVAVFSMEMGATQLTQRLISSVGHIDSQKLRKAAFSEDDWDLFAAACHRLQSCPIYIDDTPRLTIAELTSRTRRLVASTGPLGLIVVDYIQMMAGSGRNNTDNRSEELSEISRGLKSLARSLHVPVIVLSQLNRSVDARPDRRPLMSDLRESGAIEQDADVIMFIYRDSFYNKELPPEQKDISEVIIGKQRNGPIGTLRMNFRGGNTKFESYPGDEGYATGME